MKHQIDITPNNAIYIDGKRVVGRKPYGFFEARTIRITDSDLAEIACRCVELLKSVYEYDWVSCFDCPHAHDCTVVQGCTNDQAEQYASEIPNICPLLKGTNDEA